MKKYRNTEQTGRRGSELARQSFRHVLLEGMEERTSAYRPTALRTTEGLVEEMDHHH